MKIAGSILLGFFAIVAAVMAMTLFAALKIVGNDQFLVGLMHDSQAPQRLQLVLESEFSITNLFTEGNQDGEGPGLDEPLPELGMTKILSKVITEQWIDLQLTAILPDVHRFLFSDIPIDKIPLTISLKDPRDRLMEETAILLADEGIEGVTEIDQGMLNELLSQFPENIYLGRLLLQEAEAPGDHKAPDNPGEGENQGATEAIELLDTGDPMELGAYQQGISSTLGTPLNLDELERLEKYRQEISALPRIVSALRIIAPLATIIAVILLLAAGLIHRDSPRNALLWTSIIATPAAAISLLLGIIVHFSVPLLIVGNMVRFLPPEGEFLLLVTDIIAGVSSALSIPFFTGSIISAVVAVLLFFATVIVHRKKSES